VLVRGVIHHQVGQDAHPAPVGFVQQDLKILHRAKARLDGVIIRNVIAIIPQWRLENGHQPQAIHPQVLQVIQAAGQAGQITVSIAVGIHKGADIHFIEYCVFIPHRLFLPFINLGACSAQVGKIINL